jgi:hypothetical protein
MGDLSGRKGRIHLERRLGLGLDLDLDAAIGLDVDSWVWPTFRT